MIRRLRQGKIPHADVNPYEVRDVDRLFMFVLMSWGIILLINVLSNFYDLLAG